MPKKSPSPSYLSEPHWMPLSALKPDPENANQHNQRSIEAIARSFLRFGMRKNIVADRHKVIRAGNGAYEALHWIAAQITDSPEDEAIRAQAIAHGLLRPDKANKLVAWIRCEVTGLEGDEATAYALADNQTGKLSSFDFEKVAAQLGDLKLRTGIDDLGFANFELEPMLAAEWKKPDIEELPGHPPATEQETVIAANTLAFSARDYAVVMQLIAKYRSTLKEKESNNLLDSECVRAMLELWAEI